MNPFNPYAHQQPPTQGHLQVPVIPQAPPTLTVLGPPGYNHDQQFGPPERFLLRVGTASIYVVFIRGTPPTYVQELNAIYVFLLRWWANQEDRPHFAGEPVKTPSMTAAGQNLHTILFTQSTHASSRTSREEPVHISAFVTSPALWNRHHLRDGEHGPWLYHPDSRKPIFGSEQGGLVHIFDHIDLVRPRVDVHGNQVAQWLGGPPAFDLIERIGRGRFRIHNRERRRISRSVQTAVEEAEARSFEIPYPGAAATFKGDHIFQYAFQAAPAPDQSL
ncbi:hypothetical protein PENSPDRAFT_657073 [Peniophora sp. CONT]|nr:hypothetical protein PENSPDRAFT_657073 [Peniophora sp. CONT]